MVAVEPKTYQMGNDRRNKHPKPIQPNPRIQPRHHNQKTHANNRKHPTSKQTTQAKTIPKPLDPIQKSDLQPPNRNNHTSNTRILLHKPNTPPHRHKPRNATHRQNARRMGRRIQNRPIRTNRILHIPPIPHPNRNLTHRRRSQRQNVMPTPYHKIFRSRKRHQLLTHQTHPKPL